MKRFVRSGILRGSFKATAFLMLANCGIAFAYTTKTYLVGRLDNAQKKPCWKFHVVVLDGQNHAVASG